MKWKALVLFLAIAAAGILTACSAGGQEPPPSQEPAPAPVPGQEQEIDPDKEVLVYAQLLGSNAVDAPRRDLIDRFNRSHDDVQIVVKDYSLTATDDPKSWKFGATSTSNPALSNSSITTCFTGSLL